MKVAYEKILEIIIDPDYGYTLEKGGKPDYGEDDGRLNEPAEGRPDPPPQFINPVLGSTNTDSIDVGD